MKSLKSNFQSKLKPVLFVLSVAFLVSGCTAKPSGGEATTETPAPATSATNSSTTRPTSTTSSSGKVVVPAHTLSDSNPPVNPSSSGQQVSESTFNSFKNGAQSKFNNNYNYTYTAYLNGTTMYEFVTKNGYYTYTGSMTPVYYERKSGNSFYSYTSTSEGYLRSTAIGFDHQDTYTRRWTEEIKVHMTDFSNYEYNADMEMYVSNYAGATWLVKFQGGYMTYLFYMLQSGGIYRYEIKSAYETTIDIPKSYYYS